MELQRSISSILVEQGNDRPKEQLKKHMFLPWVAPLLAVVFIVNDSCHRLTQLLPSNPLSCYLVYCELWHEYTKAVGCCHHPKVRTILEDLTTTSPIAGLDDQTALPCCSRGLLLHRPQRVSCRLCLKSRNISLEKRCRLPVPTHTGCIYLYSYVMKFIWVWVFSFINLSTARIWE